MVEPSSLGILIAILEKKAEEAIILVIMSDQSDNDNDSDSFADFLAFLLSPPITSNSTNSVDSSSNIDDDASRDTTSDIDVETGNIPKRCRHSSVTFNSEIDDGCSAEAESSGDNNDADSDGKFDLLHEDNLL